MRIPHIALVYPVRQVENDWEFLLLKRTEETGGFWQGVTGNVDEGEPLINCAKRELLEETSYIPQFIFQMEDSYKLPIKEKSLHLFPEGTTEWTEFLFIARIEQQEDPTIRLDEHVAWKWCSFEEAYELLHWPNNKDALKKVYEFLIEE
ncbi:MAG: NUDIX pyrophosphatase [Asgard group archaeon]|nr:NUDIX pyrophosphatase [Asgard group archaeon]